MQSYKKLDRSGLENNGKLWNGILPMRNLTDLTIFSNPSSKKKKKNFQCKYFGSMTEKYFIKTMITKDFWD